MPTQGTGNINYSLNKNDFHKIITGSIYYFIPQYYILIIISAIYIFTIRSKQYLFPDRNEKDDKHYFNSITYKSPFEMLNILDDGKFVGLTKSSYLYIIIAYVITFIIILEGLIRNLLYSIYVNIIQVNPQNNPYNNNNCITKIKDNPYIKTIQNYIAILSLSINFLIPFTIPFLINFLKFDNYDIKHSKWITYVILYLIFFPFITVIISRGVFAKKLEIINDLQRFVITKDNEYIKFIGSNFNFKIFNISIFIFIIFVFLYYTFVYIDTKYLLKTKIIIYLIMFLIIFIFIPIFIIFFSLASLFDNNVHDKNNVREIHNISEVHSLYELLVKYNYPCFKK
jgi:hypothetical protein